LWITLYIIGCLKLLPPLPPSFVSPGASSSTGEDIARPKTSSIVSKRALMTKRANKLAEVEEERGKIPKFLKLDGKFW